MTHLDGQELFTYDAIGNMISRDVGGQTTSLTYDAESRMIEAGTDQGLPDHEFIYDGDGHRVLTIVDGVTTAYPGDHYEYEVGSGITRQYYSAGGRVAIRVSGDPEPSKNGLFFTLGDHLGSTSITVDEIGTVVAELRYKAWGETRYASGDTPTSLRYTGQRQEEGLGLYYYRTRWYDPALGRFIQADTIVPNKFKVQGLNRYTYVYNNPIIHTDPTGHNCEGPSCPPTTPTPVPPDDDDPLNVTQGSSNVNIPVSTPVPNGSSNPATGIPVIQPTAVAAPNPVVQAHTAPPDFANADADGWPPPPHVDGLPDDQWERVPPGEGHPEGYRNRADPRGRVWKPHRDPGDLGGWGERDHWDVFEPGKPKVKVPSNPEYGKPDNDRSHPGDYNHDTGMYESTAGLGSITIATEPLVQGVVISGGIAVSYLIFQALSRAFLAGLCGPCAAIPY